MGRRWQSERNPLGLVPLWAWAVIVVMVVCGALIIAM